jgi:hypothetical protein
MTGERPPDGPPDLENLMRISIGALFAIVALSGVVPAKAQELVEKAGDWSVVTRPQSGGGIDPLCILNAPRSGEARIRLTNRPQEGSATSGRGAAFLEFILEEAVTAESKAVFKDVAFAVPGRKDWASRDANWLLGKKSGGTVSAFIAPRIDDVLEPIALGKIMQAQIAVPGQPARTFTAELDGSYAAVVLYEQCLAKVR